MTRSGRARVPPLAFWSNQRTKKDAAGNAYAIDQGFPDQLSNFQTAKLPAATAKPAQDPPKPLQNSRAPAAVAAARHPAVPGPGKKGSVPADPKAKVSTAKPAQALREARAEAAAAANLTSLQQGKPAVSKRGAAGGSAHLPSKAAAAAGGPVRAAVRESKEGAESLGPKGVSAAMILAAGRDSSSSGAARSDAAAGGGGASGKGKKKEAVKVKGAGTAVAGLSTGPSAASKRRQLAAVSTGQPGPAAAPNGKSASGQAPARAAAAGAGPGKKAMSIADQAVAAGVAAAAGLAQGEPSAKAKGKASGKAAASTVAAAEGPVVKGRGRPLGSFKPGAKPRKAVPEGGVVAPRGRPKGSLKRGVKPPAEVPPVAEDGSGEPAAAARPVKKARLEEAREAGAGLEGALSGAGKGRGAAAAKSSRAALGVAGGKGKPKAAAVKATVEGESEEASQHSQGSLDGIGSGLPSLSEIQGEVVAPPSKAVKGGKQKRKVEAPAAKVWLFQAFRKWTGNQTLGWRPCLGLCSWHAVLLQILCFKFKHRYRRRMWRKEKCVMFESYCKGLGCLHIFLFLAILFRAGPSINRFPACKTTLAGRNLDSSCC